MSFFKGFWMPLLHFCGANRLLKFQRCMLGHGAGWAGWDIPDILDILYFRRTAGGLLFEDKQCKYIFPSKGEGWPLQVDFKGGKYR